MKDNKIKNIKQVFCSAILVLLSFSFAITNAYAITYYVKFNANGGSGTMSNQTFTTDEEKYLSTNTFTRTGYNFIGWNSNTGGTGTWYMPSKKVKNLTSTSGATVNVYAQWMKENQGSITSGGSQFPKDSSGNYSYENYKNHTVNVVVVNGTVNASSKVVEYYTNATFTVTPSTNYGNGTVSCTNSQSASISGNTLTVSSISSNTTCTVTYELLSVPYTVRFNANGGSEFLETEDIRYPDRNNWTLENNVYKSYENLQPYYSTSLYSRTITLDSAQTLSFQWTVSCEEYVSQDSTTYGARLYYIIYKDGATLSETGTSTAITGNSNVTSESGLTYTTVTKLLEPGTYSIRFIYEYRAHDVNATQGLNRGFVKNLSITNIDLGMPDETMMTYQTKSLTKNTFFRNGYHFLGWSRNANATTATYTDEQSVTDLTTTANDIVTLYAIWEIDTYTVTINVTNGTPAQQTFTVTAGYTTSQVAYTKPNLGYGYESSSIYDTLMHCTPYTYPMKYTYDKDQFSFRKGDIVEDTTCTVTYDNVGTYTAQLSLVNGTIVGSATQTVSVGYDPVFTISPSSGYGTYNTDKSLVVAEEGIGTNGSLNTTTGGTTYVSDDGLKLMPAMGSWTTTTEGSSSLVNICSSGSTCSITITLNKATNYTYTTATDNYMYSNGYNYCCSSNYSWSPTNGVFTISSGTWLPYSSTAGGVHKDAMNKYCLEGYLTASEISRGDTLGTSCSGWSSQMKIMTSCSAYSATDSNYCATSSVTRYESDIFANGFYKASRMSIPWDW